MSSEVEFTAKTVAQAVEKACQQFDIKEENLKYHVVTQGAAGLFGLVGAKKARIKVIIKEKQGVEVGGRTISDPASDRASNLESQSGQLSPAAMAGKEALNRIAGVITSGVTVKTREERQLIGYELAGRRPGLLIGKRGQTLEAMQYLVEKIANRNSRERVRVTIDVGGYLAKKRQNLETLAERTALKAKKNGKPATIGQLNAHDRRIIHLALKDDGEVTTKSVGRGYMRKLIVLPKRRDPARRKMTGKK